MSTTAPKPATTPIPVQLSEPEFEAFILPHLSMPKRGPKCKLGYHRVFNLMQFDIRILHGDGTNTVAKKGAMALATRATNTRKERRSSP